jgi:hypothetical protein
MPCVPPTTYGRATHGADGVANKLLLAFLFANNDVGVQFLRDVGLIRSTMVCHKCGLQMSWCVDANRNDGCRWRCRRIVSSSACSASTSIRHGSWFQQSHLNFMEVMFLTYIVRRVPACTIQQEHQFSSPTIADWAQFCREAMLESTCWAALRRSAV